MLQLQKYSGTSSAAFTQGLINILVIIKCLKDTVSRYWVLPFHSPLTWSSHAELPKQIVAVPLLPAQFKTRAVSSEMPKRDRAELRNYHWDYTDHFSPWIRSMTQRLSATTICYHRNLSLRSVPWTFVLTIGKYCFKPILSRFNASNYVYGSSAA